MEPYAASGIKPARRIAWRVGTAITGNFGSRGPRSRTIVARMVRAKLRGVRRRLVREIQLYRLILAHPRCPRRAKVFLGAALGYLAMPFDLIPDFIPVIGHLDDAVIVPGLVWLALRSIPREVMESWRRREPRGGGEEIRGKAG